MPRDTLTVQVLPGFGEALAADLTFTSGVAGNDIDFENTGREILIVRNDDAGTQTATVIGVANPKNFNNAKDIAPSIAAGAYRVFGPFDTAAFNQSDGTVHEEFTVETMDFAVVRIPR